MSKKTDNAYGQCENAFYEDIGIELNAYDPDKDPIVLTRGMKDGMMLKNHLLIFLTMTMAI